MRFKTHIPKITKLSFDQIISSSKLACDDPNTREQFKDEFFFHTFFTAKPFVVFDIKAIQFIGSIHILNRIGNDELIQRVNGLKLHVSPDMMSWQAVDLTFNPELTIADGQINGNLRYLRFSLNRLGILHLKEVHLIDVKNAMPISNSEMVATDFGYFEGQEFFLTHNYGFFSMCNVILYEVAKVYPACKKINVSHSFDSYKDNKNDDVWLEYFEPPTPPSSSQIALIDLSNELFHHSRYANLNFSEVDTIINEYFKPNKEIHAIKDALIQKYNIVPENLIALYYRGTDKHTEVPPPPVEDLLNATKAILENDPNLRVLIQTDQKQIQDILKDELKGRAFCIDELPVTETQTSTHNLNFENKSRLGLNMLAAVLIMSQSKFLVTSTGNVSYWTVLFRGHANRVFQY